MKPCERVFGMCSYLICLLSKNLLTGTYLHDLGTIIILLNSLGSIYFKIVLGLLLSDAPSPFPQEFCLSCDCHGIFVSISPLLGSE